MNSDDGSKRRGRGRPRVERQWRQVTLTLFDADIAALDRWADEGKVSRSAVVRSLITAFAVARDTEESDPRRASGGKLARPESGAGWLLSPFKDEE